MTGSRRCGCARLTLAALRSRRARQDRERDAEGAAWAESGLVFTTRSGGAVDPIGLTMNTYTHVLPDIERTAVDAAAETIFG